MPKRMFLTIAEQVAAPLREQIGQGRWTAVMPGRHEVAAELGVSDQTAEAALAPLEKEGILESQGPGRRRIHSPRARVAASSLRVAILAGARRIDPAICG